MKALEWMNVCFLNLGRGITVIHKGLDSYCHLLKQVTIWKYKYAALFIWHLWLTEWTFVITIAYEYGWVDKWVSLFFSGTKAHRLIRKSFFLTPAQISGFRLWSVCVCVCLCLRQRKTVKERQRNKDSIRKRKKGQDLTHICISNTWFDQACQAQLKTNRLVTKVQSLHSRQV